MTSRFDTAHVQRYYDRHTAAFVALGQGAGAIHRAVWGPGVATREEAFHHVEDRIAELARGLDASSDRPHLIDLGCGVGASLVYLARQLEMRGTGITLSPVQAQAATERIAAAGLSERVTCLHGDYLHVPASVPPADLVYAIESFVHGPSPEAFFVECRRLLRKDGLLVICDDVRRPTGDPAAPRAVDRFARGWHVNTLLTRDQLETLARRTGFAPVGMTDLTPHLELGRPRDRLIALLAGTLGWIPGAMSRYGPFIGGSALQTCLARGWIAYDLAVFRRAAVP